MKHNQNGFSSIFVILLIVVLACLGFTGYNVMNKKAVIKNQTMAATQQPEDKNQGIQKIKDEYEGWKTTCDDIVRACYKHPADWATDQYNTGLENPAHTEYVSLSGSTVKDGGSGSAYIASIVDLSTPIADLKIVGTVIENQPSYAIYNTSYLSANNVKVGNTQDISYINHRFSGKTGDASFDGTPSSGGYASIKTLDQAKAWFNTTEARTVLKVIQSFYYQ
jgi:hypothetical protein